MSKLRHTTLFNLHEIELPLLGAKQLRTWDLSDLEMPPPGNFLPKPGTKSKPLEGLIIEVPLLKIPCKAVKEPVKERPQKIGTGESEGGVAPLVLDEKALLSAQMAAVDQLLQQYPVLVLEQAVMDRGASLAVMQKEHSVSRISNNLLQPVAGLALTIATVAGAHILGAMTGYNTFRYLSEHPLLADLYVVGSLGTGIVSALAGIGIFIWNRQKENVATNIWNVTKNLEYLTPDLAAEMMGWIWKDASPQQVAKIEMLSRVKGFKTKISWAFTGSAIIFWGCTSPPFERALGNPLAPGHGHEALVQLIMPFILMGAGSFAARVTYCGVKLVDDKHPVKPSFHILAGIAPLAMFLVAPIDSSKSICRRMISWARHKIAPIT